MTCLRRLIVLIVVLVSGLGTASAEIESKVLMYVAEGSEDLELMLTKEVNVMRQMLEDAGYSVEIATTRDQALTSETTTLVPTINLADVDMDDYAGVILPCMAPAPGTAPPPAKLEEILQAAVATDKPIAASRAAVVPLAKAGGVTGREYAFASPVDTQKRPEFAEGTFLGTGVVRDGNISTAGICPLSARMLGEEDGTVELTRSFIENLDESI